jgi:aspartate racemase
MVGGLGVGATIHYYQELVKAYSERGAHVDLLILHADMRRVVGHVQANETRALAEYLAGLIKRMADGGAELAVVPAITPHMCADELKELSPLPLVDILEAVAEEVRRRKLKRVALFGTRYTVESRMFGALGDVEVVTPKPEQVESIHNCYFQLATEGKSDAAEVELRRIAHVLQEREGVEAILLAGTDLSVVFNEKNTDFPHVDCARAHLDAILRAAIPG